MPRKPRIHFDGAVYHVFDRGVERRSIFIDDRDRIFFLETLKRIAAESSAEILAYCLMGNHFHLAIRVRSVKLGAIVQRLLTGYCLYFNRRYGRAGHLFEGRYGSRHCLSDAYLYRLIRYIHMNPVRAKLVSRPEDWPWSDCRKNQHDLDESLDEFDPWPKEEDSKSPPFAKEEKREIIDIGAEIAMLTGIEIGELRSESRRRDVVAAKRRLTREAIGRGHSRAVIARWLNTTPASVSRYAQRNTVHTVMPDPNSD